MNLWFDPLIIKIQCNTYICMFSFCFFSAPKQFILSVRVYCFSSVHRRHRHNSPHSSLHYEFYLHYSICQSVTHGLFLHLDFLLRLIAKLNVTRRLREWKGKPNASVHSVRNDSVFKFQYRKTFWQFIRCTTNLLRLYRSNILLIMEH